MSYIQSKCPDCFNYVHVPLPHDRFDSTGGFWCWFCGKYQDITEKPQYIKEAIEKLHKKIRDEKQKSLQEPIKEEPIKEEPIKEEIEKLVSGILAVELEKLRQPVYNEVIREVLKGRKPLKEINRVVKMVSEVITEFQRELWRKARK